MPPMIPAADPHRPAGRSLPPDLSVGSGSIDEQDVKNVDSREILILRDLLHHFTELRRQLNGKIGNALRATGLQDPGDDPSERGRPGLGTVIV
jgi:hypothetical protein